jgi:hypothetical protein
MAGVVGIHMIDSKILKYVQKSKLNAIRSAWKDEEGYWINLNDGYENGNWGGRTIHEDTIKWLRYEIAAIVEIKSDNE